MLDEAFKPLRDSQPQALTAEQRQALAEALRLSESLRQAEYVMIAGDPLLDHWPEDRLLRLRLAVLDHYRQTDVSDLAELLGEPDTPERNERIRKRLEALRTGVAELLRPHLRAMHVPRQQIDAFVERYDLARAAHAGTEDLADEKWEVRVRLPGEIVAYNADTIDGNETVWHFGGEFLTDRGQVLMVTSRLGRARGHWRSLDVGLTCR